MSSFRNVSFPGRVSLGQSPRASCKSRDYRPQRFPLREASEEILLRQGFGGSRRLRRVLTAAAKFGLSRLFQTIPKGPHHANGKQRAISIGKKYCATAFRKFWNKCYICTMNISQKLLRKLHICSTNKQYNVNV